MDWEGERERRRFSLRPTRALLPLPLGTAPQGFDLSFVLKEVSILDETSHAAANPLVMRMCGEADSRITDAMLGGAAFWPGEFQPITPQETSADGRGICLGDGSIWG